MCERNSIVFAYPLRWRSGQLLDAEGTELARERDGAPILDDLRVAHVGLARKLAARRALEAEMAAQLAVPAHQEWSPPRRDTGVSRWWEF